MMVRIKLIDGDALLRRIEDTDWYHVNERGHLVHGANSQYNLPLYKAGDILDAVENAPEVRTEQVICCEECKWCGRLISKCGYPTSFCEAWGRKVSDKDYCSRGCKAVI